MNNYFRYALLFILLSFFFGVIVHVLQMPVLANEFRYEVDQIWSLPLLESHYAYFYIHLFTFLPVFLLSFDRNVHFYKKWRFLWLGIMLVGGFFIVWDIFFTEVGIWGFNKTYLTAITIFNLPIEEWLFFVTVPYACVFIYECLNFYVKFDPFKTIELYLTPFLIIVFLAIAALNPEKHYTFSTFALCSVFTMYHYLYLPSHWRSRFYFAYLITLFPFWLVNGVLTGGFTESPIVLYNPSANLGFRVHSIPVEDTFYGFLLVFGVVTIFEWLRSRGEVEKTHS